MLPLWIIDLAGDGADRKEFKQLVDNLTEKQKDCYWRYTAVDSAPVDSIASCRTLLDKMVSDGRIFYNLLQSKGFVIRDFQVCITGDVTGRLTRSCFQLLPILLREIMTAILGENVARGVEITGLLFIPHNLNHWPAKEREECALFLEEMNTMTESLKVNYYNRTVVYQDIQRSDVRFYPALDKTETGMLLFQYLLHLFYAGNEEKGFFDRISGPGFYALGAASVYYDHVEHRETVLHELTSRLTDEIKNPGNIWEQDTLDMVDTRFGKKVIGADSVLSLLQEGCQGLDIDLRTLEGNPNPHPVSGFYKARLYPSYYLDYLRFMPARAVEFARAFAYTLSGKLFNRILTNREVAATRFKEVMNQYTGIFRESFCRYSSIPQMKAVFAELKNRLQQEKDKAGELSKHEEREVFAIPGYLSGYYADCKTGNSQYSGKEVIENMKIALQKEPTVMGLLNRCFLMGLSAVLAVFLLLQVWSPLVINPDNIVRYSWMAIIFLLPFAYHFGIRLRRHFLFVRKQKHILLAHALLKSQIKASARLYEETGKFYDELIAECDRRMERCDEISKALNPGGKAAPEFAVAPTIFNQPLTGGNFREYKIADIRDMDDELVVDNLNVRLSAMDKEKYVQLLKNLFAGIPVTMPFVINDPAHTVASATEDFVKAMKSKLNGLLRIHKEENAAKIINYIDQRHEHAVNLEPLFRMAGINGMTSDRSCEGGCEIRCGEMINPLPGNYPVTGIYGKNPATVPLVMVTSWCRLTGLDTQRICDAGIPILATAAFPTRCVCFFAQHRQGHFLYQVGKAKVPVTTGEMEQLENELKALRS